MAARAWFLIGILSVGFSPAKAAAGERLEQREASLLTLPEGLSAEQVAVSPSGQRFAFASQGSDGRLSAVVDGKSGKPYDWIIRGQIYFTPDSRHTVYQVRRDDRVMTVIDSQESSAYESCDPPVFSPSGGQVAFVARKAGRYLAVANGKEVGKAYSNAHLGAISPAGRVAYMAAVADKQCVVVDGAEGDLYEQVRDIRLSPDGRRIAFRAFSRDKWAVVVDGIEQMRCEAVDAPVFSDDGRHVGYLAGPKDVRILVIDGKEVPMPGRPLAGPVFSPDGVQCACAIAKPNDRAAVVVDGAEGQSYQAISTIRFSPDGRRLAYVARRGGRSIVVLDGQEFGPYERLIPDSLAFSPDGGHLAWIAGRGEQQMIVVDGVEGGAYTAVLSAGPLAFDPTGAINAIAVRQTILQRKQVGVIMQVPQRQLLALHVRIAK
jgi:hypothetical protein